MPKYTTISIALAALFLTACAQSPAEQPATQAVVVNKQVQPSLDTVLAEQDPATQARYQYRNPKQTLEFFGIEPGMTVMEALPGGGWYSKILLPYLGKEGKLIGVDYAHPMWAHFGGFATPEFIEKRKTWAQTWAADAENWRDQHSAQLSAHTFSSQPESLEGTVDVVLFIRALHNMARFESEGPYLNSAIQASYQALKPGGIVGVVQHRAREDRPDSWADGSNGYLKQSRVIEAFTAQGFEFVEESDINANPKDQAAEGDIVWRLPPSLAGSKDDAEMRAAMLEIGESHRMTLKFRKPL